MPTGILERLSEGVALGDGGYLLELERRGYVQAGPFVRPGDQPDAPRDVGRAAQGVRGRRGRGHTERERRSQTGRPMSRLELHQSEGR